MRSSLAEVVNQVRYAKEKVVVTRHGKPMVAVVPLEDLEKIREAESLAAGRKALAEGDEGTPLADLTG